MKTFYIFRHGETFATKLKSFYWHRIYSAPILDEGKPALVRLGNFLKDKPSDVNFCSPFLRCRQTAEIVSKITGKEFKVDRRIREYEYFELPYFLKRRILNFLKEMESSKYNSVMICSHAIIISLMIQYLTQGNIRLTNRIIAPLPGVLTIIKNGKAETINFNESKGET